TDLTFEQEHGKVFRYARGLVEVELLVQVVRRRSVTDFRQKLRYAGDVAVFDPRTAPVFGQDAQVHIRLGDVIRQEGRRIVTNGGAGRVGSVHSQPCSHIPIHVRVAG